MKSLVILGSTGSIGRQALQVVRRLKNRFRIVGLTARTNWQLLARQIKEFRPRYAALLDPTAAERLKQLKLNHTKLLMGRDALKTLIADKSVDLVLSAISGADGLPTSIWALEHGKTLALANKESLVMAGPLLLKLARTQKATIIPVDSEHSAIFQTLRSGQPSEVNKVILTASGGPFYQYKPSQLKRITVNEALRHPVWAMGPKITIDSATLMNKALEIIEARWLFNLEPEQIKVVFHPQSIVHSMVEFQDGSVIAQMSYPDMRLPIQFALSYPARLNSHPPRYLFRKNLTLDFIPPDLTRFPALRLGYRVARTGGTSGAVLNAANEEAVKSFIRKKIPFASITALTERVLKAHQVIKNPTLNDIYKADKWAREKLAQIINANHHCR